MEGANVNTSTGMSNNGSSEGYVPSTMVLVTILTIFGVILLVGILGNILLIAIIACVRSMRTSVNKCLFSLALADLVVLIILPFLPIIEATADSTFPIGADFCKFSNMYNIAARILTTYTFFYVTIDRYFALCYPLKFKKILTVKRLHITLLAFWIISLTMSVPIFLSSEYIIEATDNVTHYYCYFGEDPWMFGYETFIIVFAFFIPIPIILILYGRMIHHLRQPIGRSNVGVRSDKCRGRRGRGQVVIMLLVLTVIFVLSQLPYNLIILLYFYLPGVFRFYPYNKFTFVLTWVSRLLIYVNSASNPVIYFAFSTNFRGAFCELCCCRKKKNTQQQFPASASFRVSINE